MNSKNITSESVSSQLFNNKSASTFEIKKIFEEKFLNNEIQWSGTVENIAEFSYDFVFKDTKGVKVDVNIHEPDSEFGKSKIYAVVNFPSEHFDRLRKQKGDKFYFAGKIIEMDSLMQRIYITDGRLLQQDELKEKTEESENEDKPDEDSDIEQNEAASGKKRSGKHRKKSISSHEKSLAATKMLRDELERLKNRKTIIINLIIAGMVSLFVIVIIAVMRRIILGSSKSSSYEYIDIPDSYSNSKSNTQYTSKNTDMPSPLDNEYRKIKMKTSRMPNQNSKDIAKQLKIWQKFVNKNKRNYPDDKKIKQAEELIKTLKELQTMYN